MFVIVVNSCPQVTTVAQHSSFGTMEEQAGVFEKIDKVDADTDADIGVKWDFGGIACDACSFC